MNFPHPLTQARFVRREKRFFIHAETPDGHPLVAHTNNTGSMRGCLHPGANIWLSPAADPKRKLKFSLELVEVPGDEPVLVGVNTILANTLVRETLENQTLPLLTDGSTLRAEVKYGSQNSRVDFLATDPAGNRLWIEVKNVSLVENGHARFPDSPTERGRKHLLELAEMVQAGDRAALVFCIQRRDAQSVGPADDIDPAYGQLLRKVMAAGVEVFGLVCRVSPEAIFAHQTLPIVLK